ncbi:MAG: glycosyltransferase, partial [Alphaproteobacteria bacterium]|nr:glycosyltransferase [Alphaproteobacteria bacterium]
MRLLLLSDPNSSHTIKWAKSLSQHNINILIFGFGNLTVKDYDCISNIEVKVLNEKVTKDENIFLKLRYLKAIPLLKKIIKDFNPDIVHAHFASSYGFLGAMIKFHPFLVSAWGSDVFNFPLKSPLHKMILKYNLNKADKIISTSNIMAKELKFYTNKEITVIPFGIDIKLFRPMDSDSLFHKDDIVIGTIKSLEKVYGIEYLIKAFKIVRDKHLNLPLKLLIVGEGSLEYSLKNLTKKLSIEDVSVFTGKIPFFEVSKYHNMLTIYVSVSINESFGVAALEASACAKPVVVSNIGGFLETVKDGESGYLVPPKDPKNIA